MQIKINGEAPFQVLASNFSISPSNEGYTLQVSADGINFSDLFAVGAGVTRMVTEVSNGSYFRCAGNQSAIVVNWEKQCGGGGGGEGGDGVTSLNGQKGALNLKTINNKSILGTGNIDIEGGEGGKKQFVVEMDGDIYGGEYILLNPEIKDEIIAYIKDNGIENTTIILKYVDEVFMPVDQYAFIDGSDVEIQSIYTYPQQQTPYLALTITNEGISYTYEEYTAGAYSIVDELPEDAEDGTMVYLRNDSITYKEVSVPLGYTFDLSSMPESQFAHLMQYYEGGQGPDEHGWAVQSSDGQYHIWFTSDYTGDVDIYDGDGWKDFWIFSAKYDEANKRFHIAFNAEASIDGSDGFFFAAAEGINYDTFTSYLKEIVVKAGQYIRKNGEWTPIVFESIPVLDLDNFNADALREVLNAHKNRKPYTIYSGNLDNHYVDGGRITNEDYDGNSCSVFFTYMELDRPKFASYNVNSDGVGLSYFGSFAMVEE